MLACDVGEAWPGDVEKTPVMRCKDIVNELMMLFADHLADQFEVKLARQAHPDLADAFVPVRHGVNHGENLSFLALETACCGRTRRRE